MKVILMITLVFVCLVKKSFNLCTCREIVAIIKRGESQNKSGTERAKTKGTPKSKGGEVTIEGGQINRGEKQRKKVAKREAKLREKEEKRRQKDAKLREGKKIEKQSKSDYKEIQKHAIEAGKPNRL